MHDMKWLPHTVYTSYATDKLYIEKLVQGHGVKVKGHTEVKVSKGTTTGQDLYFCDI